MAREAGTGGANLNGLARSYGVGALKRRAVHGVHRRGPTGLEQCAVVYTITLLENTNI